jgi:DNA-binding response OmpR family regulator
VDGARILLVEDDPGIAAGLARALTHEGYVVAVTASGLDAMRMVTDDVEEPDLVLLDLGLPDADGVELCRRFVELRPSLRVVAVTARAEELDVVIGLDSGAVDYVTKPFRLAELLARVRAQLRQAPPIIDDRLKVADLEIDMGARRVWLAGAELDLRPKEYDLLVALATNAGRVLTRERLMAEVWDEHWFGSTKTLDVHMAVVRRKLRDCDTGPVSITTIRGVGYRLESG